MRWLKSFVFMFFWIWNCQLSKCVETEQLSAAINAAFLPDIIRRINASILASRLKVDEEEEVATGELSDVNKCLRRLHIQMGNTLTTTLSGVVGVGWDDLTNKITLPIFATKYLKCQTTPDGHFLLPDNVLAMPIQEVIVDRTAKLYKFYNDIEKGSIKADRTEMFGSFVGGGTYASGNQKIKKYFSHGKTSMLEAQIGYKAFTFIAEEQKKGLDPIFKEKIEEIMNLIHERKIILAEYQAECLIRDYGTHVVNKAVTGAMMKYKVFTSNNEEHSHGKSVTQMQSDVAISFLGIVKGGENSMKEDYSLSKNGYENDIQYSTIETLGGPDIRAILGAKSEQNIMKMDNIVGLEHEGVPIYTLIHTGYFDDNKVNTTTILKTQNLVLNATKNYYIKNTRWGCTNVTSSNYDYQANSDDNTCNEQEQILLFNGVFQKCDQHPSELVFHNGERERKYIKEFNFCENLIQRNILTQQTSCPDGYEEVEIISTTYVSSIDMSCKSRSCSKPWYGFGFFEECATVSGGCGNVITKYIVSNYWCRLKEGQTAHGNSGAFFGGIHKQGEENVFTKTFGCPDYYKAYPFLKDFDICISHDFQLGQSEAVKFGGFYSCQTENKRCPAGFSSHLLTIHHDCAIFYCVHPQAFLDAEPEPLKRPPFLDFFYALKNRTGPREKTLQNPNKFNNQTLIFLKKAFNATNIADMKDNDEAY